MKQIHDPETAESPEDQGQETRKSPSGPANPSRRRFTGAGLSASVIMTLASRPALANHCSWSAGMSGNLSMPHQATCHGLGPTYWMTSPDSWGSTGYEPGKCNPLSGGGGGCSDYSHITFGELEAEKDHIPASVYTSYKNWANWVDGVTSPESLPIPSYPPTTLADACAGSGLAIADPSQTMMQSMWAGGNDSLSSQVCAALLNCDHFGEESFGYTRNGLLYFISTWTGSLGALKDAIADLNVRGGS